MVHYKIVKNTYLPKKNIYLSCHLKFPRQNKMFKPTMHSKNVTIKNLMCIQSLAGSRKKQ